MGNVGRSRANRFATASSSSSLAQLGQLASQQVSLSSRATSSSSSGASLSQSNDCNLAMFTLNEFTHMNIFPLPLAPRRCPFSHVCCINYFTTNALKVKTHWKMHIKWQRQRQQQLRNQFQFQLPFRIRLSLNAALPLELDELQLSK